MADNGISPELIDALRQLADQIGQTTRSFDDYTDDIDRTVIANRNREKREAAEAAKRKEELDKFAASVSQAGMGLLNLGKSMSTPQSAFQSMGEVTGNVVKSLTSLAGNFGKFGAAIKGLGEVGSEAIKFLTAETGKAFATFGKLSGSGVVESFQGMRAASDQTRLTFDELSNVFAKNSEALATFGGSAVQGAKDLQKILKINKDAAFNMQKMGVGFDEFAEIQATYIANLTRTGGARAKTDAQLAEGAREYAEQLVVLSRLTGQSREALQKRETELANSARFQAKLRDLELKGRGEEAERLRTFLKAVPAEQASKWIEYFAAPGKYGGVIGKESAELAVNLSAMGININTFGEQIQSGQKSTVQGLDTLKGGFDQYHKQVGDQVMLGNKLFGDFYLGMSRIGEQGTRTGQSFEGSEKNIKEGVENQKKLVDNTAAVANETRELAVKIGLFSTETDRLMAVNKKIAEAMNGFLDILDKVVKGEFKQAFSAAAAADMAQIITSGILAVSGLAQLKGIFGKGNLPGTGGTVPPGTSSPRNLPGTGGTVPPRRSGTGGTVSPGRPRPGGAQRPLGRLGEIAAGMGVLGSTPLNPMYVKIVDDLPDIPGRGGRRGGGRGGGRGVPRPGGPPGASGAASRLGALGRVGAVGAAGAAGYAVGSYVVKPGIDKLLEMGTGQKDITLGSWLYDKLNPEEKKQLETPITKPPPPTAAPAAPAATPTAAPAATPTAAPAATPTAAPAATPTAAPAATPTAAPAAPAATPTAAPAAPAATPTAPVKSTPEESAPQQATPSDAATKTPASKPPGELKIDEKTQTGNKVKVGNTIREGGTVSWRTNNPGNVSYGELAKKFGAIGRWMKPDGDLQQRTTGIAIMPTLEAGDQLKMALWRRPLYSDTNIATGTHLWTRGSKSPKLPPDIQNYASDLAKAAGASLDTNIPDLSNDQLSKMVKKQRVWEGFKEGKIMAAANGAVVQPKTGGTLVQVAEAGQSEAIVPLPDGRTIPVTIKNSGEQTAAMRDLFDGMNQRLDSMINLLAENNKHARNIAQNTI